MLNEDLLEKINQSNKNQPIKLIEFCNSFNNSYKLKNYSTCVILTRVILDYIPTIFGYTNRGELISQYRKSTFKKSLSELHTAIKNLADDLLHNPASKDEVLKITKATIDNQLGNILIVLDKVADQLKNNDLRSIGNQKLSEKNKLKDKKSPTITDNYRKYFKDKDNWYKEYVDNENIWIYKKDNLYQIIERADRKEFSEPWTQVYPDSLGSGKYNVDLVYNGQHIKRFIFIYCDGGRIEVVMPERELLESEGPWKDKDKLGSSYSNVNFYWREDSLGFDLTKLIGSFYIYEDLYGIARRSKIEIKQS